MRLDGIELRNFRSIGYDPVVLDPLKKCNIIVGQNNAGKSNILKAVQKILDNTKNIGHLVPFDSLDLHRRTVDSPFKFRLWFLIDSDKDEEIRFKKAMKTDRLWFDITWGSNQPPLITDNIFTSITEYGPAKTVVSMLNRSWNGMPSKDAIKDEFLRQGPEMFSRYFAQAMPSLFLIPEFRQIRSGDPYSHDGIGLIELLAKYKTPQLGSDADELKFEKIQNFVRRLLQLPNATLDFPPGGLNASLVIKNDGLRLPLSSFGTGVHQLLIMVTAALSRDNAVCCIEEPEIHLHPRLQRKFIDFLLNETSNQYLITTHSPALINSLMLDEDVALFYLKRIGNDTVGGPILDQADGNEAINALGLKPSDLLQANCVIWVEGRSDRVYIKRWLELMAPDLREGHDYMFLFYSKLPPLSADPDDSSDELINFLKCNPHAIMVVDSDKKSEDDEMSLSKANLVKEAEASGGISWVTLGREIENYLSSNTIMKACNALRGVEINLSPKPFDEFEKIVDKALKAQKAEPLNYQTQKLNYARKFAQYITLDDISSNLKLSLDAIIERIRQWNE